MFAIAISWVCVQTSISMPCAAATTEFAYCPATSGLFEPLFFKLTSDEPIANEIWPKPLAHLNSEGSRTPLEVFVVNAFSSPSEKWFVVITPDTKAAASILLTITDNRTREVALKEEKSDSSWARRLFREADGYQHMISLLERQRVELSSSVRAKLLAITTSFPDSRQARFANFIIGSELFQDFEQEFSNDGPDGCFGACYGYLERATAREIHDPVYADAMRRLAMAKAWSSAFDEAAAYCRALIASKVSETMTEIGVKGLAELPKFQDERKKRVHEPNATEEKK